MALSQARGQLATLTADRNSLTALVDTLKAQLATKGGELAVQLQSAAELTTARAAAEARAREADRAKSRLDLEVTQLKEVRGLRELGRKDGCG